MFTKRKQQNQESGFTIVETLVSISILLIVIVAPMTIAARGLQSGFFANDQTTAVFLAQEAMEQIIQLRENNALAVLNGDVSSTWAWYDNTGSDNPIHPHCKVNGNSPGCGFNDPSVETDGCGNNGAACILQFDGTRYFYSSTAGDSKFTRETKIFDEGSDAVALTTSVIWEAPLFNSEIVLQTWLYDHYNRFEN